MRILLVWGLYPETTTLDWQVSPPWLLLRDIPTRVNDWLSWDVKVQLPCLISGQVIGWGAVHSQVPRWDQAVARLWLTLNFYHHSSPTLWGLLHFLTGFSLVKTLAQICIIFKISNLREYIFNKPILLPKLHLRNYFTILSFVYPQYSCGSSKTAVVVRMVSSRQKCSER